MSAPPNPTANGPPRPPPGRPMIARKPKVNPLVARKKIMPQKSVTRLQKRESAEDQTKREKAAIASSFDGRLRELHAARLHNGGWSTPVPGTVNEFPLVTTKRALMEGIRYHVMRLNRSRGGQAGPEAIVDVTDQNQFPRPVTLHRRDPRQLPAYKAALIKDEVLPSNPAEEAEAERLRQQKADREAQRALDQAQIAPVSKSSEPKKDNKNKKEKVTTFYGRNTDEQKKQSGLRYEETLPWHLEDAEGKSGVWVGSYVAGLSDVNCALVIDGGNFRMIPLERYYRFDEKPKFNTYSLEDAENMMKSKKEVKRWVMKDKEKTEMEKEREETRQFLRGRARVKTESATSRAANRTERQDDFELDMSGDEFQDDDETPGFEADDEDAKDAKTRIRREALGANLFGEGEESKVDEEEREAQLEKLKRKMVGKKTKKDLMKLEHAMDYEDTDSEKDFNNPFTDSSESESETDEKKEDDKKGEEKKSEQPASGSASKGTNTPSSKQKGLEVSKKGKLKRPGSPNLSESSGNESTRKKVKLGKTSVVASRSATPLPGRPKGLGGATSDGEATAGEGSDGGLKLKKKTKLKTATGATGTPSGSRAGSPAPPASQGSPAAQNQPLQPRIEASDIIKAVQAYPQGITIGNLMRTFVSRIHPNGVTTKNEWIQLVKENARYGADRLLRPKT
ncbi:hypothetical protein OQA88_11907 [Cercophora sp. LCS_1]